MKYLKKFENVEEESDIEIGDYVLVNIESVRNTTPEYFTFMNNNVGIFLKEEVNNWNDFLIGYENIPPENIRSNFLEKDYTRKYKKVYYAKCIVSSNVIEFSKSKEELQLKLNVKKYNI